MPAQAVSDYLNEILLPQLTQFGVSETYCEYLCQTVETQMLSLLLHWDDVRFRKTVLLIASEEGAFYEPNAKVDIKCFVVMTLRNSPFESLQSDVYSACGLSRALTDTQVKTVTARAIAYFNRQNFSRLVQEVKQCEDFKDLYGEMSERCPTAWNALWLLANSPAKRVTFEAIQTEPFQLDGVSEDALEKAKEVKAILDGYSPEIDPALSQQLGYIAGVQGLFGVDCFKMLSRNYEKVMTVLEYLLTRGCFFMTSKYLISNGYVERRSPVLKAASCKNGLEEMKQHYAMTSGISPMYKRMLNAMHEQFE